MNITAERTNLNNLLGVPGRQLRIPPYQRPYAWEDEHVDQLWDDIVTSLSSGHFMGSLVLTGEDAMTKDVIDGQQRLTTLMLLLALIRDRLHEVEPSAVGRIQQFLTNAYDQGERSYKLRTGDANWPVFRDFVLKPPAEESRKHWSDVTALERRTQSRNAELIQNARRLNTRLDNWLQAGDAHAPKLQALEKTIMQGLEFVVISVPALADAFVIFETLNDRGLALSAGDLLKNHLLQKAAQNDEDVEELADEWDEMLAALEGADITRFLRHYLLIRHPRVQKDDVFQFFKQDVGARGPRPLMAELLTMATWYGQFTNPRQAKHAATCAVLTDLQTLRATMCYSSLLAARAFPDAIDEESFVELARLAEVLTFRYSTICSKDSKELERSYHLAAKTLWDSKGHDLDGAREILKKAVPGTNEFLASFQYQSMGRKYVIDYVLRKLEQHRLDEKSVLGTKQVHIEHIMPRSLDKEWKEALADRLNEHEAYLNRWGNLTLLGGRKNISASNRAFPKKKETYEKSEILLTRDLAALPKWDFDAIDARQRQLAEISDKIWAA